MKLLDRSGIRADHYTRTDVAGLAEVAQPLLPLAELEAGLAAANGQIGVEIGNTTRAETLAPHLARLSLVAIAFPSFADGRGFSIARRLRRAGFAGTLRAVGPLIADQFAYALACGFDEIELPDAHAERQPFAQWQKAGETISSTYQRGYQAGGNILDQRRAARKAGGQ